MGFAAHRTYRFHRSRATSLLGAGHASGRTAPAVCAARIVALCICLHVLAGAGLAIELWSDEQGHRGSLDVAGKATTLISHPPFHPILFPQGSSRTTLLRLRFGLNVRHSDWMDSELTYEQRARWASEGAGFSATSTFLPSDADVPFRITPLDCEIAENESDFTYAHELDRAFVALHPAWGEVVVGRQAIGLGRGVLFSAVDLFAPFSPLEVDREWRRGVDAFRAEYRLSSTTSAELISVFGDTWDDSAVLGRLRGYIGDVDGSLIVGQYAEDFLVAGVVSTIVHDAEVHGELALFDTSYDHPDGTLWGDDDLITKIVVGTSYTFNIGNGLTALAEYHYSGFGLEDVEDALLRLWDPDFIERMLRGDTQILGRQALAGQLSYPLDDAFTGTFLVLTNPTDGSGVLSPSLRLDLADNITLIGSAFIPWGDEPSGGQLESEYGATPAALLLQASIYY